MHDPGEGAAAAWVDHAAKILVCEGGEPPEAANDIANVITSLDDPLTRVERFRTSDLLGVALEQIRDAMDQATTLGRVHRGPATVVEGDAGGRDRQLGVLTGRLIDHDDKTAVCRASDLAHESLGSFEPLTVDE